jgi:hypothetical protein
VFSQIPKSSSLCIGGLRCGLDPLLTFYLQITENDSKVEDLFVTEVVAAFYCCKSPQKKNDFKMPVAKRPNTDDSNALVLAKKSKNEIVLSKIHNAGSLVQSGVSNTKS